MEEQSSSVMHMCDEITWSNNYDNALSDECGATGSVTVDLYCDMDECGNDANDICKHHSQ